MITLKNLEQYLLCLQLKDCSEKQYAIVDARSLVNNRDGTFSNFWQEHLVPKDEITVNSICWWGDKESHSNVIGHGLTSEGEKCTIKNRVTIKLSPNNNNFNQIRIWKARGTSEGRSHK